MTAPSSYSVDSMDVLLGLLRPRLIGVTVLPKRPDPLPPHVPLVVLKRTGGSSFAPKFWDQPYINIQCWAAADPATGADQSRAAFQLADRTREALWEAWETQSTTLAGHIVWLRESQAPLEEPDSSQPYLGRYMATYEMRLRRPR